jgi:hypothetical protein
LFPEENPQARIPRLRRNAPILTKLPRTSEEIVIVFAPARSKRGFQDKP